MNRAVETLRPSDSRRGFVLVGVIMIVLALTILGLSLFSLSSYEAQFMNRSINEEQTLQYAMGGLARARFTLATQGRKLSNVKLELPFENVIYARASQDQGGSEPDTSGPVDWSGNDVVIRVTAAYRGIQRTVEASYHPLSIPNYYKRLLTISNPVTPLTVAEKDVTNHYRNDTVVLRDSVWQKGADLSWESNARLPLPPVLTGGTIPVPAAGSFILDNASAPPPSISGQDYRLEASENGMLKTWYSGTPTLGTPANTFTIWDQTSSTPTIWVRGRAIWCIRQGIRFEHQVNIRRSGLDPDACLVIVAQNGKDDLFPTTAGAIWFFGGMNSEIPVILVSDGWVRIENFNDQTASSLVPSLSIFSDQIFLMGPYTGTGTMDLNYNPSIMEPQLDFLMEQGALPNATASGSNPFRLSAGTWHVVP